LSDYPESVGDWLGASFQFSVFSFQLQKSEHGRSSAIAQLAGMPLRPILSPAEN
jgi:hypothetical protein